MLLSSASDVILQRCMLSPSFPKAGYSEKCIVLLRGTFSLWASSHLIKQAQEMSLLADWPCVFLWRPPTGTADMHSVSPWQRTHLTCLSPNSYINLLFASVLSFNTHLFYLSPFLPNRNDYYNVHSHFALLVLLASFPFFPLVLSSHPPPPPSPFSLLSSSHSVPKAKQTWLIKSLSNHFLKVPHFRVMGN